MQTAVVFACLIVAISAHGMAGGNYGYGMMNNMMNNMGQNMMGMNNMGMNNMGMRQQNMLQQVLQGILMNNMGNNMRPGQEDSSDSDSDEDDDDNKEEMEKMFMQMMMKMMEGQMGGKDQEESKEMKEMMALKNYYEMTRMADAMMVYMDFKQKEVEFGDAMAHLCLMVNATYTYSMKMNMTLFEVTTDAEMEQLEKQAENWTDQQKGEFVIRTMLENKPKYEEYFFRFAMWSCWSAEQYMQSAVKLQKMMDMEMGK